MVFELVRAQADWRPGGGGEVAPTLKSGRSLRAGLRAHVLLEYVVLYKYLLTCLSRVE